ncbi:hypothetical protein SAMN04490243_2689 [Robiginitalea myxolifaciens]|uniref:Uncharacterized protein n=2 Tax=Robiginitalea myxolifaciens TaxID=400055 RepID=A0A1I6HG77_9FLAO|nr:hypothetical protein SAMN04490243_2689 [Robiginitalea myxolifaciens]
MLRVLPLVGCYLLLSCSKDEPETERPPASVVFELTALADTDSDFLQLDLTTDQEGTQISNLSATLMPAFLANGSREFTPDHIAFYTWEEQLSRVYLKNLQTGTLFTEIDLCDFSTENDVPKTIRSVSGSTEYVVLTYAQFPPGEPPEIRLRIFSRSTGSCQDLLIEDAGQGGVSDLLFQEDLLVVFYRSALNDLPVLRLVDLPTASPITSLNLSEDFQAASLNGDRLVLFGKDNTFGSFDITTRNFSPIREIPDFPVLQPGLFSTKFSGDRVLINYIYQQPSLFFAQPALYDLQGGFFELGGTAYLPRLQNEIEAETGDRFLFGAFDADPDSETIAIAYVKGDGSPQGGVVIADFQGNLKQIIPTPLVPEQLLIRNVRRGGN